MSSKSNDLIFQCLDWRAQDVYLNDVDDNEDDNDTSSDENEDEVNNNNNSNCKYIMKVYGVSEDGESISVTISDFTPYFYIRSLDKSKEITLGEVHKIENSIRNLFKGKYFDKDMSKFKNDFLKAKLFKKKELYGFNANEKYPFIRLQFNNTIAMKFIINKLHSPLKVHNKKYQFKLYESNVEPLIRFFHCTNINPSGWIGVKNNSYKKNIISKTKCKHDVMVRWNSIKSVDKENIAPLLIASFDIECTSSHGDFPVAKKDYAKVANELIENFTKFKENNLIISKQKEFILNSLKCIFECIEGDDEKDSLKEIAKLYSKVYFKSKSNKVSSLHLMRIIDDIFNILNGAIDFENPNVVFEENDINSDKLNFFKPGFVPKYSTTEIRKKPSKDAIFENLKVFLTNNMPSICGDEIIQIGTTFHYYGKTNCHYKHIVTLGSCSDIDGVDEIKQCKTETEVLLEWTKMINRIDPDVVTGYNIFGFDMDYMYKRSIELGCCNQFMKLGRIKNKTCKLVEKSLSSSALGDNLLRYFDMDGRVVIDLMKVVQRDHKLDSYKLDLVASNFIQGKVINMMYNSELNITELYLDDLNGIEMNNFVNFKVDDNIMKLKIVDVDAINKMVIVEKDPFTIHETCFDKSPKISWGLAKDDVSPNDIFKLQKGSSTDRSLIAKYCVQDCALCNIIIIKLEIIANNIGMSNVCTVPLSYIFMRGQGVKIFSLVSKQCREDDFVIPTLSKYTSEEEEDEEGYEGAIVLDPKPGIYVDEPISVMDYASLYPSSMISENISHDSLVLDSKYDNLPGYTYVDVSFDVFEGPINNKRKVEKTCRYAQFPNGEKGVLPRILMNLLKQRKTTRKRINEKKVLMKNGDIHVGLMCEETDNELKMNCKNDLITLQKSEVDDISDAHDEFMKAVLDGLQLAYKTTANSLYGQVGAKTSQIYLKELAASTTATGRNLIMAAKKFMEDNYDANIVYGDTDSIFVDFKLNKTLGLSGKDLLQKSIDMSIQASDEFKKKHLKAPHDLEYEKTFFPFIILSKKRYVGNLYEHDVNKFKQKCMGIVLKRRDNANIVKQIYGGMIDIILNECDIRKSIEFLKSYLKDLIAGRVGIEELIITKTLKGIYKDPSKIAHKVLADRMKERDPGSAPQTNDRIPYVYIDVSEKKTGTKLQGDKIEDPKYIIANKLKPDYDFYITNQLMKPISQLLALALEDIPGYKYKNDQLYFARKEKMLMKEKNGDIKKVKEKISQLRMDEVNNIIFNPIIKELQSRKKGNTSICDYFKRC